MWGREGDATYTSPYCERGRQAPGGAQRSEARAEWSTALARLPADRGSGKPTLRLRPPVDYGCYGCR